MSAPWTPGPWRVDPKFVCDVQSGDGAVEIGCAWERPDLGRTMIVRGPVLPEPSHAEANARLIAAAPDLAEACRMFVESYDIDAGTYALGKLYEAREAARAALAKARGETA